MKNCDFQACCRQWSLGTQESRLQPIPTLILAQQSEIKSCVLDLTLKTVCCFHSWSIQIPEASFHFFSAPESGAADRGEAPCARDVPAQASPVCAESLNVTERASGRKGAPWDAPGRRRRCS